MRTDDARVDPMEGRLLEWAAWLGCGGRGDGYPAMNVLHKSWLPPAPGSTPTMKVAKHGDARERALHAAIGRLSVRLQNTLVVVYVQRVSPAEQVLRLDCGASTVRARVLEAKRMLASA